MRIKEVVKWRGSRLESYLFGKTFGFGVYLDVRRGIEKMGKA